MLVNNCIHKAVSLISEQRPLMFDRIVEFDKIEIRM